MLTAEEGLHGKLSRESAPWSSLRQWIVGALSREMTFKSFQVGYIVLWKLQDGM